MEKNKILVVEDETDIRELIVLQLVRTGFQVDEVRSAELALQRMRLEQFDLIILDWMLPGMSGIELCRFLRNNSEAKHTPILFLTAKVEPEDIVEGLEAGADDYLTKPFDSQVFLARVRALLRRRSFVTKTEQNQEELRLGTLVMFPKLHKVKLDGQDLDLTPSEFKLLQALIVSQGRVLTRERLIELVQGEGVAVVGRTVDTHVFGLRKKLGSVSEFIETVRGVGYRIKFSDNDGN